VIRMNSLYSIEHEGRNQCVVVCNRSGMEDRLMYAGTSTMYTFHGGPMRQGEDGISIDFTVEGSLGQGTEGVLVRELEV
jgi:protein N-terminal amidase